MRVCVLWPVDKREESANQTLSKKMAVVEAGSRSGKAANEERGQVAACKHLPWSSC